VTTAVVTGGAGFLGSHLCDLLRAHDHHVVVLDNLDTGSLRNIDHLRGPDVEFHNVDVVDPIELEGDVDVIFHLASPASPIDYLRLPLKTLKVDSWGTQNVLMLARRKRARFVLASTSEVYGDPLQHPQSEEYAGNVNPIGPRGVYDESKRYAEAVTMTYHRQQGLDTAIARIFNTYGPRMRTNDGRAVPTFVRQALQGKPLTVFGDGSQTRSFCYMTDLVDGLLRLAESDAHEPLNLGNPAEITLGELAETVTRLTASTSGIVYSALPLDDPKVRRPNIARARERLAWQPSTTLEEGLAKMIAFERASRSYTITGLAGS
jgi:dTDP-glucose 4,6-dehydratase